MLYNGIRIKYQILLWVGENWIDEDYEDLMFDDDDENDPYLSCDLAW